MHSGDCSRDCDYCHGQSMSFARMVGDSDSETESVSTPGGCSFGNSGQIYRNGYNLHQSPLFARSQQSSHSRSQQPVVRDWNRRKSMLADVTSFTILGFIIIPLIRLWRQLRMGFSSTCRFLLHNWFSILVGASLPVLCFWTIRFGYSLLLNVKRPPLMISNVEEYFICSDKQQHSCQLPAFTLSSRESLHLPTAKRGGLVVLMDSSGETFLDDNTSLVRRLAELERENLRLRLELAMQAKCDAAAPPNVSSSLVIPTAEMRVDTSTDYALFSKGASINTARTSAPLNIGNQFLCLFGWRFLCFSVAASPRFVIRLPVEPGDCWVFAGSKGTISIKLAATIRVSGFSYEHLHTAFDPTNSAAPFEFDVFGFSHIDRTSAPVLLGSYSVDIWTATKDKQVFVVKNGTVPVDAVEFHIHSNHGHSRFTCLYKFYVHGTDS